MFKVIPLRVVVLADQVPVPSLPLGVVGKIAGFRITYNGASALPPTDVAFTSRNDGSPAHVSNAQIGISYIVDIPVFGDESSFVTVSTANTADPYWVDFDLLVEVNDHAE